MLKKNKLFQTERVRQQNSIVIYYYTTTENSRLINSMTKLEILKWTYSDKDHKGNTLSSLLIHGRSTQIKEKWQNKHNPSKSATSLQFWNAPSETTVCMVWWRQTEVSWVKITCDPPPNPSLHPCWDFVALYTTLGGAVGLISSYCCGWIHTDLV